MGEGAVNIANKISTFFLWVFVNRPFLYYVILSYVHRKFYIRKYKGHPLFIKYPLKTYYSYTILNKLASHNFDLSFRFVQFSYKKIKKKKEKKQQIYQIINNYGLVDILNFSKANSATEK